ncbi:hypothetical protein SPHINGO391_290002 [Sphingomonas aurantiaca]|uniref:Uncharacterized protein n=1 Tax=Sphingomonas aurantiaca TaxID=185949 RepID=A0A5E7Y002_9SPHN|nr:hypothetical protein SPHINGO391_290002 [Sphingomonas aurantiaca]
MALTTGTWRVPADSFVKLGRPLLSDPDIGETPVNFVIWSEAVNSLYRTPSNGPCWARP